MQVCKALRDGVHPIALREFRYSLTDDEERELVRLVEKQMRCSDPHIVKPLGALQTLGLCSVLSVDRLSALRKALMLVHAARFAAGLAPIARPDSGWYIACPLFERGSLAQALEGPKAGAFRWYKQ